MLAPSPCAPAVPQPRSAPALRCGAFLRSGAPWKASTPHSSTILSRSQRRLQLVRKRPAAGQPGAAGGLQLRLGGGIQSESPLGALAELFGSTGTDPGHWNYSPEWFGTQGGGWGRDAGVTVFAAHSECGNGRVTVTAHKASNSHDGGDDKTSSADSWEEWRVLRFNDITRQTVARVRVAPAANSAGGSGGSSSNAGVQQQVVAQPDCLAQEYLKSTASVLASLLGLQRLYPSPSGAAQHTLRVLCIGVGGGSLPLFLSHHYQPYMDIDAVELDPAVVAAATQAMGLPTNLPNMRLHTADARAFLEARHQRQQQGQVAPSSSSSTSSGGSNSGAQQGLQQRQQKQQQEPYDIIFMDAFDGQDDVPAALCTPEFAALLGSALHPTHGLFLINLHSMDGRATIATFKSALLGSSSASGSSSNVSSSGGSSGSSVDSSSSNSGGGTCFTVGVERQSNVCVAVARGLQLPADSGTARKQLKEVGAYVAHVAGYRFPAGSRACKGYQRF